MNPWNIPRGRCRIGEVVGLRWQDCDFENRLIDVNHSVVYYERDERQAGKSKYGIRKMLHLAVTGITGYSLKPLYAIFPIGLILLLAGIALLIWQLIASSAGNASMLAAVVLVACLAVGIILCALGVVAVYVGQSYEELKHRPNVIISERTEEKD